MAEFVDAYDTRTGAKVRVPSHFFEIESLSRNLSKTPRRKADERRRKATDPVASANPTETPASGDQKE